MDKFKIKLYWINAKIQAQHHVNIEFRRLSKYYGSPLDNTLSLGMKERQQPLNMLILKLTLVIINLLRLSSNKHIE